MLVCTVQSQVEGYSVPFARVVLPPVALQSCWEPGDYLYSSILQPAEELT